MSSFPTCPKCHCLIAGNFEKHVSECKETTQKRTFESGANRQDDTNKLDFEGFYSPLVKKRFAEYMHKNRHLPDGSLRDSDNWQKGIPLPAYAKSLNRHFEDFHLCYRGYSDEAREDIEEALCGLIFNAQGYLFEILKTKRAAKASS